jgi:hypothetical protein
VVLRYDRHRAAVHAEMVGFLQPLQEQPTLSTRRPIAQVEGGAASRSPPHRWR